MNSPAATNARTAITPKKALNPVFASSPLTACWGLLAGSRTRGGKSRLKVARIRYGLKIKRYAAVYFLFYGTNTRHAGWIRQDKTDYRGVYRFTVNRRSHIAKVYRGERPQKGRYREFYRCDIDVIGEGELSVVYDAEIPRVIYSIFSLLDLGKFTIRVSIRKILSGLIEPLELSSSSVEVMR